MISINFGLIFYGFLVGRTLISLRTASVLEHFSVFAHRRKITRIYQKNIQNEGQNHENLIK